MHGIVCAGALAPPALQALGVTRVPLLSRGGETLLARSIRCLQTGGGCTQISVLGPPELPLPAVPGLDFAPYSGRLISDGISFVRAHVTTPYLLVSSADCPALSPECIAELAERGKALAADFVYPAVSRAAAEAQFPGGQRTYRRFKDGSFTGGNVFLVRRDYVIQAEAWLAQLFARRKNPLAMGQLFGLGFLWLLLTGHAPLRLIEERVSRVLRGSFRALLTERAEIAVDVDKVSDFQWFSQRGLLDPLHHASA